jgi:hypothetical protein
LPDESVAVKVTVVCPNGKTDGAVLTTCGRGSTRSVAYSRRNAAISGFVAGTGESDCNDSFPGTDRTGGVVSRTRTPKLVVPVWFELFVALQLTVVAPSGNIAPLAGVHVTGRPPSTMSLADGAV